MKQKSIISPPVPENSSIQVMVKRIHDKIRMCADTSFAEYDLTGSQAACIRYIQDAGGSLSQRELERTAKVSHPTIVGIVTRMQDKGFVTIETDQRDRRNRIIMLTGKAWNVANNLEKRSNDLNEQIVSGLSSEEREELHRFLDIMDNNLSTVLERRA